MTKKVCLVDGSGYIFRAFYALPPLTSPDGVPVNAVLGFTNMFMRLTQKIACDYCLVLFVPSVKTIAIRFLPIIKEPAKKRPKN